MNGRRIGIIMNGVTGRMGLNQHLVRSVLAIRKQGGVVLTDGSRLVPDPILVGRNGAKLEQIAKENGVARWTTDLAERLLTRTICLLRLHTTLATSVQASIAAGKHVIAKSRCCRFSIGAAAGGPCQGGGCEARCRARQALSAGNAQAKAAGGQWLLR